MPPRPLWWSSPHCIHCPTAAPPAPPLALHTASAHLTDAPAITTYATSNTHISPRSPCLLPSATYPHTQTDDPAEKTRGLIYKTHTGIHGIKTPWISFYRIYKSKNWFENVLMHTNIRACIQTYIPEHFNYFCHCLVKCKDKKTQYVLIL